MYISLRKFLKFEAASGIILMPVTVLAMLIANSRFYPIYDEFFHAPIRMGMGPLALNKSLLFWINDGLMIIFFFVIGLEIKREFIEGHLSRPEQRILPGTATLGGIIVPALIYIFFNYNNPDTLQGWAIPTATDIAFTLGVLALLGKTIPQALKIFVLTVAALDDLGAVLIIALFYTKNISAISLLWAFVILMVMILINWMKVKRISIYIFLSIALWIFVLKSGIHPTVAGVLAALTIPLGKHTKEEKRPLVIMEQSLQPMVAFVILPIFAFANAGVPLTNLTFKHLIEPIPLGIMLGLFLGKQIGIFLGTFVPVLFKWGQLPNDVSWRHIYGVSVLCGIGFTMSLFIGALAFEESGAVYENMIRLGILTASFCAAICGYLILKFLPKKAQFLRHAS